MEVFRQQHNSVALDFNPFRVQLLDAHRLRLQAVPHLVLLDEDTIFARVFLRRSQRHNVRVSVCETLEELFDILSREHVHVAIIDWGFLRTAKYYSIDLCLMSVPTLFVSSLPRHKSVGEEEQQADDTSSAMPSLYDGWPGSPLHKEWGVHVVLKRALLLSGCLFEDEPESLESLFG